MIKWYHGQDQVGSGTYLDTSSGELLSLSPDGGVLPGAVESRFLKAPMPLMLLLAPVMGLVFILFLPFAGILVLSSFAVSLVKYRTVEGIATARATAIQMAAPRRQPGVSFLHEQSFNGDRSGRTRRTELRSDDSSFIDRLEKEISERRHLGEK